MSDIQRLKDLADRQLCLESKVANIEHQLKKAKEELAQVSEVDLPLLMEELEVSSFDLAEGYGISVKETIRASVSLARAREAMDWLISHGHQNLIRHEGVIPINDDDLTEEQKQLLEEVRGNFEVKDNRKVHPQTLAAFVREMLEDGQEIPLELFGVHRQRIAKITKRD